MIHIKIDSKKYGKKEVLQDINIALKKREFLCIIGPSGCGKSTLLNIIANIDTDFEGSLYGDFGNISYVFQDDRLLPWLTVKENLLLISKTKDINEILNFLKLVDLDDMLEEYPKNLSGGMKKKVSLVRAFINKPKLILLDEPFISLDYPSSIALKKDFLKLCNESEATVILVTHDISEAILLSNRMLFFDKNPGRVILEYENNNKQEFNMKKIDDIKNNIFENHPKILEGVI